MTSNIAAFTLSFFLLVPSVAFGDDEAPTTEDHSRPIAFQPGDVGYGSFVEPFAPGDASHRLRLSLPQLALRRRPNVFVLAMPEPQTTSSSSTQSVAGMDSHKGTWIGMAVGLGYGILVVKKIAGGGESGEPGPGVAISLPLTTTFFGGVIGYLIDRSR